MGKEQKMIYKKILFFFFIFFGPVEFWFGPVKFEKLEFYWPERASEKNHECRALLYSYFFFATFSIDMVCIYMYVRKRK